MSEFIVLAMISTLIVYPFFGAVLYAEPWSWLLKKEHSNG